MSFERAAGFASRFALRAFALKVGAGFGMHAGLDDGDAVQRGVHEVKAYLLHELDLHARPMLASLHAIKSHGVGPPTSTTHRAELFAHVEAILEGEDAQHAEYASWIAYLDHAVALGNADKQNGEVDEGSALILSAVNDAMTHAAFPEMAPLLTSQARSALLDNANRIGLAERESPSVSARPSRAAPSSGRWRWRRPRAASSRLRRPRRVDNGRRQVRAGRPGQPRSARWPGSRFPLPPLITGTPILSALSHPIRTQIVLALAHGGEHGWGELDVPIANSTLSHHLKLLRDRGVTRAEGSRCFVSLRRDDLDHRFAGLLDVILHAASTGDKH